MAQDESALTLRNSRLATTKNLREHPVAAQARKPCPPSRALILALISQAGRT